MELRDGRLGLATAHELYHPMPLRGKNLDRYYGEFVRVGHALGGTDLPTTKAETLECLESYLPKLAVTHGKAMGTGPNVPMPQAAVDWAIRDTMPKWAKQLLQHRDPNIIERTARRTAVWSIINGINAAAGPTPEFRQAQARVKGGTTVPTPCRPTCPAPIRSVPAPRWSSASSRCNRLPQVLGAVSARGDHGELRGAVHREPRIARRHVVDDVDLGMALVHQLARPLADPDRGGGALIGDAGLVERGQEAHIRGRIAGRIGVRRRGHTDEDDEARKHYRDAHGSIFVQSRGAGAGSPGSLGERPRCGTQWLCPR